MNKYVQVIIKNIIQNLCYYVKNMIRKIKITLLTNFEAENFHKMEKNGVYKYNKN